MQNNTMQFNTIQYNTIQCNAVQYNTKHVHILNPCNLYNEAQYNATHATQHTKRNTCNAT